MGESGQKDTQSFSEELNRQTDQAGDKADIVATSPTVSDTPPRSDRPLTLPNLDILAQSVNLPGEPVGLAAPIDNDLAIETGPFAQTLPSVGGKDIPDPNLIEAVKQPHLAINADTTPMQPQQDTRLVGHDTIIRDGLSRPSSSDQIGQALRLNPFRAILTQSGAMKDNGRQASAPVHYTDASDAGPADDAAESLRIMPRDVSEMTGDIDVDAETLSPSRPEVTAMARFAETGGISLAAPLSPFVSAAGSPNSPIGLAQSSSVSPTPLQILPQTVLAVVMKGERAMIQIDPPELGRIQIDYVFEANQTTKVILTAESEAGRMAMAERMPTLLSLFQDQMPGQVEVELGLASDASGFDAFDQAFGADAGRGDDEGETSGGTSTHGSARGGADPITGHSAPPAPVAWDGRGGNRLHMRV